MHETPKGFRKLIEDYTPSREDYLASAGIINRFFDEYLIPGIHNGNWNLCIRIERKGSQLYLDQKFSKKMDLRLLYDLSDRDMQKYLESIKEGNLKGKSILIFDDSIKNGNCIRHLLKGNSDLLSASKITVAVLLAKSNTLKMLKSEFPNVEFYSELCASEENFSQCYVKKIQPYVGAIVLPLQNTHPIVTVDFGSSININVVDEIFNIFGYVSSNENNNFALPSGEKKLFEFKKEILEDLPIFQNLKALGVFHNNTKLEDSIIIRLYIRRGLTMRLYMQPIILEGFKTYEGIKLISSIDNYVKNQIICQFIISKIMPRLANVTNISRFSVQY